MPACRARTVPVAKVDVSALVGAHRWFELRQAVAAGGAPPLARGVAELAFNENPAAETDLLAAVATAEREAHSRLFQLYLRQGRYRQAFQQIEARLRAEPNAADALNARTLLAPLAQSPDLMVERRMATTLPLHFLEGNLVMPVEINGHAGAYVFDCGANISVISAGEAARTGLRIFENRGSMVGMTGAAAPVRAAVADTLRIGNVTLRHVAFIVNPDNLPPFNDWPKGNGGILGIQVAMAMGSVAWSRSGAITIATGPSDAAPPNLAFDDNWPVTQVRFQGTTLAVTLDTGAQQTVLYPPFAAAFPALIQQGKPDQHQLSGFSGTAAFASVVLPALTFEMAGRKIELAPAEVLTQTSDAHSRWYAGNFGMDLLTQAAAVRLDFDAMRLSLK